MTTLAIIFFIVVGLFVGAVLFFVGFGAGALSHASKQQREQQERIDKVLQRVWDGVQDEIKKGKVN